MVKIYCLMLYISPQNFLYTTVSHLYYSLVAHIELSSLREGTALLRFLALLLCQGTILNNAHSKALHQQ